MAGVFNSDSHSAACAPTRQSPLTSQPERAAASHFPLPIRLRLALPSTLPAPDPPPASSPFLNQFEMPKETTKTTKRKAAEKAEKAPKAKGKKDPKAPKRALSAYMFFSQDWRERIKAENPDAGFGEIGKLLGAKWKELDEEEKKPYVDQAAADKARAEQEKNDYDVKKADSAGSGDGDDDDE